MVALFIDRGRIVVHYPIGSLRGRNAQFEGFVREPDPLRVYSSKRILTLAGEYVLISRNEIHGQTLSRNIGVPLLLALARADFGSKKRRRAARIAHEIARFSQKVITPDAREILRPLLEVAGYRDCIEVLSF